MHTFDRSEPGPAPKTLAPAISSGLARRTIGALFAMAAGISTPAHAQSSTEAGADEIIVFGRGQELLGRADAASEGTVGGADLLVRPMLRVAELLEAVPGMIAVQHSGSGKANQYFLRGFNLDHGTDFTTYVDGMPWNLRSHGHGQGYLDVNGLIPEIVERIDYRKGTYRADVGDFSMASSSFISTIDRFDSPFVSAEGGQYGWGRVATGGTRDLGDDRLLTGIVERSAYDGPWERPEQLQHTVLWGKYIRPTSFGTMSVTATGYDADWHPTEQIPERGIGTVACEDPFCTLDPTATGHTGRWIGSVQMDGKDWRASAYLQHYDWQMQSNPTYDFQINQFDRRWTTGGRYQRTVVDSSKVSVSVGGEFRYDDIGKVGVEHWDQGHFVEPEADNAIKETSLAGYVETTWTPVEKLRLMGGLRADFYDFDVTAHNDLSAAGSATDNRVSPKAGIAYEVGRHAELYGSWGHGFHSNDARGVVNVDSPVPGLSPGTGYEGGARFEVGAVKVTAALWWLNLDSELSFVGDTNSVEPKGGSKRDGYELTLFWRPIDWLGIDAVYTGSTARYVDNPDGDHIEGSVESAGEFGIAATKARWDASFRIRYLGPYALTPDNAHRAETDTAVSIRAAYRFGRNNKTMIYAQVLNLLNDDRKDIVYWYAATVPGLDPPGHVADDADCDLPGANCRVSRAEEPRTVRVGVRFQF